MNRVFLSEEFCPIFWQDVIPRANEPLRAVQRIYLGGDSVLAVLDDADALTDNVGQLMRKCVMAERWLHRVDALQDTRLWRYLRHRRLLIDRASRIRTWQGVLLEIIAERTSFTLDGVRAICTHNAENPNYRTTLLPKGVS